MRQVSGFVRVWMKKITWKFVAFAAKIHSLAFGAFISSATMRIAKEMHLDRYASVMGAASVTAHDLQWNPVLDRDLFNRFLGLFILFGQIKVTVKTVQSAWGGHLEKIHRLESFHSPGIGINTQSIPTFYSDGIPCLGESQ